LRKKVKKSYLAGKKPEKTQKMPKTKKLSQKLLRIVKIRGGVPVEIRRE
jgi:hypothetical protein